MNGILDVALVTAAAIEACGLRYLVGGSLASSFAGEPRSTLDLDLIVELPESKIPALAVALGSDFYFDPEDARTAVRERTSTNAIHEPTGVKVDLFISNTALDRRQMNRRRSVPIPGRGGAELFVYAPEDILLQKLRWYRLGGEASDRQWRDVTGIVRSQGEHLDRDLLRAEAPELGVGDLLERALEADRGR